MPRSVRSLAEELAEGRTLEHIVRLEVGGCRIDVTTDHAALADKLRRYFQEVVTPDRGLPDFDITALEGPALSVDAPWTVKRPDPGKKKIKEEWLDLPDGRVVRKRLTGMVFAFGGGVHFAYGPCDENDNQIINFVNNRYMQWRLSQGYLLAHAGAVARDGRCLALCGPSGAGKSTTALALVGEGLDFVSNDRLLFKRYDGGVEVLGIPKHPRVNPGTILFNPLLADMIAEPERTSLLRLAPDELRELERKHDVVINEVFGPGRFLMQGELEALVVLNWNGSAPVTARPVDLSARPDLLPMITKSPGLFYEPEAEAELADLSDARYLEVLEGTRVLEITGRQDFSAARRICVEALDVEARALG